MNKRLYVSLVVIIFILAILFRVVNWPNVINDINCDEAMSAINAKFIAENGKDMYGTTYPVYFESWLIGGQSALPVYIMAFFIKIFGFSNFAVRLPMLIISMSSLLFIFLLTRKISKDKNISLIALTLLAINPWDILQSQWVLDCNFFPHFFLIAVYFLYVGIEEKKNIHLYISMFVFAITLYTYGIALYLVPIFLLITAIYLIKNKKITFLKLFLCVTIFIIFALPIILMTLINLFDLPTLRIGKLTIQNFSYVTRRNDMIIFSENKINTLFNNIMSLMKTLVYQNDGLQWNGFPRFGTIYLISMPIIIVGIILMLYKGAYKGIKERYNQFGVILILNWMLIGLIAGVIINNININRINIIWYALIIINAIGIYEIIRLVSNKKIVIALFGLIYLINFVGFINYFYKVGTQEISNSFTWSQGLVEAIKYVDNMEENTIILSTNVTNIDKKDVFIRYATKVNQKEKYLKKEEFFKYYDDDLNPNINFSTNEKIYNIEKINDNSILINDIYVIRKSEYDKIDNKDKYEKNIFNNYIVLKKIMEN